MIFKRFIINGYINYNANGYEYVFIRAQGPIEWGGLQPMGYYFNICVLDWICDGGAHWRGGCANYMGGGAY